METSKQLAIEQEAKDCSVDTKKTNEPGSR